MCVGQSRTDPKARQSAAAYCQDDPREIFIFRDFINELFGAPSRAEPSYALIRIWLYVCCGLVFAMVLLGGITRLTESGLSMVDWHPVTGWLPPISAVAWADAFNAYRGSPGIPTA